ncbi:MAG: hybrid sensor histidine kinase/response regulator [Campylobacterota bacterium]|nr:hybrid sensor histidine kinase/response regulator [Campylobacterota bacterium]
MLNNKPEILIVDDIAENIKFALEILKSDYAIAVAMGAKKALAMLEDGLNPDLILLDIIMPEMDGFELCSILKADRRFKHIPIIFLTVLENDSDMIEGLNLGAVDYISKPIEPAVLKARVDTHVKLKNYQDTLLKNLEEKEVLLESQSKLAMIGEIFENVIQQWNQPISLISMTISNIRIKKSFNNLDEDLLEKLLCDVETSTDQLSRNIREFNSFLIVDSNKKFFRTKDLFQKVFELYDSNIQQYLINIQTDIEDIELNTYKSELQHVLINIIGNSIDALVFKNNKSNHIIITAKVEKEKYVITICDNGGGIETNNKEHIFDKYFTTKGKKGTGLGLYMSKNIVCGKLKGTIKSKSVDEGVCFIISLPL